MALILRIYTADKIIESEIDLGHKYTCPMDGFCLLRVGNI